MKARYIRRAATIFVIPAVALGLAVSPALAQSAGGNNGGSNPLTSQMPAESPAKTGPATTATGKSLATKPAPKVATTKVKPKNPATDKGNTQHQ